MAPFAYISDIFSSDICESHSESTVITPFLFFINHVAIASIW